MVQSRERESKWFNPKRERVSRSEFHTKTGRKKSTREKTQGVCEFIDLEEAYNRINREAL